jgi:hypothetical protein
MREVVCVARRSEVRRIAKGTSGNLEVGAEAEGQKKDRRAAAGMVLSSSWIR